MNIKIIRDHCGREPYMVRLTLFTLFGFTLKLHIFLRSDEDRELHDHPWAFWTWIICGEYWEEVPTSSGKDSIDVRRAINKRQWSVRRGNIALDAASKNVFLHRKAGSLGYRPATWAHRVQIINPCATLVLTYPKGREWGFHTREGWRPWTIFTDRKQNDC